MIGPWLPLLHCMPFTPQQQIATIHVILLRLNKFKHPCAAPCLLLPLLPELDICKLQTENMTPLLVTICLSA